MVHVPEVLHYICLTGFDSVAETLFYTDTNGVEKAMGYADFQNKWRLECLRRSTNDPRRHGRESEFDDLVIFKWTHVWGSTSHRTRRISCSALRNRPAAQSYGKGG